MKGVVKSWSYNGGTAINQAQTEERHPIEVNLKMRGKGRRVEWYEKNFLFSLMQFLLSNAATSNVGSGSHRLGGEDLSQNAKCLCLKSSNVCICLKLQNVFVSRIVKCVCLKFKNVFVSNCQMYLSRIQKCICLKLSNVFVSNCKIY